MPISGTTTLPCGCIIYHGAPGGHKRCLVHEAEMLKRLDKIRRNHPREREHPEANAWTR